MVALRCVWKTTRYEFLSIKQIKKGRFCGVRRGRRVRRRSPQTIVDRNRRQRAPGRDRIVYSLCKYTMQRKFQKKFRRHVWAACEVPSLQDGPEDFLSDSDIFCYGAHQRHSSTWQWHAILVHSTSRDAARPFWPLILRGVDRHFPPQRCSFYFSTDAEDAELRALMRSLRTPPTLLVRSSDASHGWAASLLEDLKSIREPWVFHLADDVLLPDPISVWSIDAILDVAQRHNASLITLHNESFNIWFGGSPKLYSQRLVDNSSISVRRGVSSLEFYRPSIGHTKPSRYVVNQQFSLFQTRSLTALLEAVPGNTTPQVGGFVQSQESSKGVEHGYPITCACGAVPIG